MGKLLTIISIFLLPVMAFAKIGESKALWCCLQQLADANALTIWIFHLVLRWFGVMQRQSGNFQPRCLTLSRPGASNPTRSAESRVNRSKLLLSASFFAQ